MHFFNLEYSLKALETRLVASCFKEGSFNLINLQFGHSICIEILQNSSPEGCFLHWAHSCDCLVTALRHLAALSSVQALLPSFVRRGLKPSFSRGSPAWPFCFTNTQKTDGISGVRKALRKNNIQQALFYISAPAVSHGRSIINF